MDELISLSSQLHLVFIVLLSLLMALNIYLLIRYKSFHMLSKRLELFAPQYYIVLAGIFFTGIIIMAVRQFSFSLSVWLMIFVWVAIIALSIVGHKIYKKTERTEASQNGYKQFLMKKYIIDFIAIAVTSGVYYLVH